MAIILLIDNTAESAIATKLESLEGIEYQCLNDATTALRHIPTSTPDLLLVNLSSLTDEEQNVLRKIRHQHARLPIVVVSSPSDRRMTAPVVQRIAAHYVPSNILATQLAPTICRVLEIARRHCDHLQALQTAQELTYRFVLANDRSLVPPLVAFLQNMVQQLGICDSSEVVRVGVALDEALTNAVYHGNLELDSNLREEDGDAYYQLAAQRAAEAPFRDRKVEVKVTANRDKVVFTIRDEGSGFDPSLIGDPTDPDHLERASGRGIFLMHSFMDEVRYNKQGNEVTMVKTRTSDNADAS